MKSQITQLEADPEQLIRSKKKQPKHRVRVESPAAALGSARASDFRDEVEHDLKLNEALEEGQHSEDWRSESTEDWDRNEAGTDAEFNPHGIMIMVDSMIQGLGKPCSAKVVSVSGANLDTIANLVNGWMV